MRAPLSLVLGLSLVACSGGDTSDDTDKATDGVTDTTPVDTSTSDTSTTEPAIPWPYPAAPELEGDEWKRGAETFVRVIDAPPGATVTFYVDEGPMGDGPCSEGHCFELGNPTVFAEVVADDEGVAHHGFEVAADEPPGHHYLQAVVDDPEGDAWYYTNPLMRYVTFGEDETPFTFVKAHEVTERIPHPYTDGNSHTGGIAWIDYNNDYFADLFISNGGGLKHWLFRNDGDGTFTDVSHLIPKPVSTIEDAGAKFGDIDNDGDSDLIVPVDIQAPFNAETTQPHEGGPNLLYLNRGDGTFTEVGANAEILDPRGWRNICAALADVDNDGWLDIYFGNWAVANWPHDNDDRLLRNTADGYFEDVTAIQGTTDAARDTLTAMFFDADNDGLQDLYVGNIAHIDEPPDYEPDDIFYKNEGGTFRDATGDSPGMGDDAIAAMGMDIGDIDADGDWDLYITDKWDATPVLPKGNPLYVNNGDGTFSDNLCVERGVCVGWVSWPANFADFDNDGDVDLFTGSQNAWMPDQMFINDGTGHFAYHELDALHNNRAKGGSIADYDGDGDVDIFLWNQSSDSLMLRHEGGDIGNWVEMRLFGTVSNRDAIGAVIRATLPDGRLMMRRVSGGDSAHSQQELIVHFGLGDHTTADVEITWPSGAVQDLGTVTGNRLVFIDETEGIRSEELWFGEATWSSSTQELSVQAKTSFGGRTTLDTAFGTLDYDAAEVGHGLTATGVTTNPGTVELTTSHGGAWSIPVVEIP